MSSQPGFSNKLQSLITGNLAAQPPKIVKRMNQWFSNLNVRQKIGLGYLAALGIAIAGVGTGILLGEQYQKQAWQSVAYTRTELNLLTRLQATLSQTRTQQQQLIFHAANPETFEQEYQSLQQHEDAIERIWQELTVLVAQEEHNQVHPHQEIPQLLHWSDQAPVAYFQVLAEVVSKVQSLDSQSPEVVARKRELLMQFTDSPPAREFDRVSQALTGLIDHSYVEAEETEELLKTADSLRFKTIALSMLGSATTAALLSWYISQTLAKPLQQVTQVTRQALNESNFDLQAPVTTNDEIGALTVAINKLLRGVRQLLIEQKTNEIALRDSEQKFRSLYEMTSDAVMLLGEQGFLDCNSAALKMLGCNTKAEIIGKQPIDFSPIRQPSGKLSTELVTQQVKQMNRYGSDRFEWLTRRIDGSEFFAEVLLSPVDFGNYQLVQFVIRDITERKQAEATLWERASQLRVQNQVLNQLTKHPAVTQGQLAAASQVITEATAATLNVERVSLWLYDETKTQLDCLDLFQRFTDLSAQPDLTAQHSNNIQLQAADYPNYFQALDRGELIVAADACSHPQTYEFAETYLRPLQIVSMIDSPLGVAGQVVGVLCVEQVGQQRQWSPEDENFVRAIADITVLALEARDRKLANHALQRKQEELQQILEKLSRTQTQMVQSEKMSSLGQLVAGVAHEINNPVNFIHGNVAHAENYIDDLLSLVKLYQHHYPQPKPKIAEQLAAIDLEFLQHDLPKLLHSMRSGSERIREIVRSLRNFSRLDEAEFKTVDIHEGIDSTLMILQHRLKDKPHQPGIQVVCDYGTLPPVECYPGQLNQVFMNLLSNAIDALETSERDRLPNRSVTSSNASRPKPLIRIRTETLYTESPRELWIAIHISDNGQGIPESVRSRLFDPFFTTKPVGKGTGLGLSISYQIVTEKHGGSLTCHCTAEEGTEFVIQLPVHQLQAT